MEEGGTVDVDISLILHIMFKESPVQATVRLAFPDV